MRKTLILCLGLATTLGFVSCSEEEGFTYSTNPIENTALKDILVQKGYQFDANGKLLLDDLANNTTTLDLSGTQISTDALAELSMFPNLTDVDLSDNGYGPAFDFAKLPEQITGIDLTGNEIYDTCTKLPNFTFRKPLKRISKISCVSTAKTRKPSPPAPLI